MNTLKTFRVKEIGEFFALYIEAKRSKNKKASMIIDRRTINGKSKTMKITFVKIQLNRFGIGRFLV